MKMYLPITRIYCNKIEIFYQIRGHFLISFDNFSRPLPFSHKNLMWMTIIADKLEKCHQTCAWSTISTSCLQCQFSFQSFYTKCLLTTWNSISDFHQPFQTTQYSLSAATISLKWKLLKILKLFAFCSLVFIQYFKVILIKTN